MPTPALTRNEQIMRHLVGTATGGGILGSAYGVGGRVFRERAEAFQKAELPAVVVIPRRSIPNHRHATCSTFRTLIVDIFLLVNGGSTSMVADPVHASIHEIIMADRTFGGLCQDVRDGESSWSPDRGDSAPGELALSYEIDYTTTETDLS